MRKLFGFTIAEIMIIVICVAVAAALATSQVHKVTAEADNSHKKTAINAMYYSLEEDFYKRQQFYPEIIDDRTLPTMDKALLTDPHGKALGDGASAYRYEPTNCHDGRCQSYRLRAILVGEDIYVKQSRH